MKCSPAEKISENCSKLSEIFSGECFSRRNFSRRTG